MNARPNRIVRIFMRHSLPLVIVALLLGSGAMFLSRNFIRSNSVLQANQKLAAVQSYYDVILDEMDSLSLMFSTNPEMMARLMRVLQEGGRVDLDNYREIRLIRSFLSAPANARPYIHNIYVYLENPQDLVLSADLAFIPLSHLEDSSWFGTYQNLGDSNQSYSERVHLKAGTPTEQSIIRIMRPITSQLNARIGVIVLDIKEAALSEAYQFQEGEILQVHTRNGELLFYNTVKPQHYADEDMQYFQAASSKYGWKYTLGMYKPMLYRLSATLMYYTIALTLIALLLGLYLTHRTNRQERKFLSNVMKQLTQVADADLTGEGPEEYRNIFDYLNHHVIKTFLEQDYLRWQKEAMEYRALQMQINPHFLFNTLDTINWKAVKLAEGENDVSRMILLLSKLLKYSLQVDDFSGVALAKELEQTSYYVELQKIRFPGRFTYTEHIDPTLLDVRVPSLLLQPILENAFNHGFVEGKVLCITVDAFKDAEKLKIVVTDDGKGLDEHELAKLNNNQSDVLKKKKSLGLMNINKRLMLFSQGKSPIVVASGKTGGVTVTIVLPLRRE
ncbi:sensor histidine kinase [Sphaerochaeta globosa]|uniref:Integral membrane sensor signal transduction histidine kinase n=1 Tax=Sphaerochaeta globosa (strain ATCC BAA-1886 / DSM 22777 / Buddy) TaxID=158189 RepID=F0RT88_SPHGB|nr:sensor histidine kinase [Sphaerochaeta globosa]ADY14445.1 integral membrane sensor signal transduction histidine kinase [Sphaerochaeta globosa str. Buddy]